MEYLLPANIHYGKEPIKIDFPDDWDVEIARMKGADKPALKAEELYAQLLDTIGKETIEKDARNKNSAVIIFEDMARPGNFELIAKFVVEQLQSAGVPKQKIRFIAAVGMHRTLIRPDFIRKLGKEIVDEYPVFTHDPFFGCRRIGSTTMGTPVEINSDVLDAEYKITLGSYLPHGMAGYGGSYKLILPGVSSYETIKHNHSKTHLNKQMGLGRLEGNVLIEDMKETAMLAGVDFSIGCAFNEKAEICRVFAGDITQAYDVGCKYSADHYETVSVKDADVVLVNCFMKATEPSNALNSRIVATFKQGVDVILASNTPEGTCPHYLYGRFGLSEANVGPMYNATRRKASQINRLIAFSTYPDIGGTWWFGRPEEVILADSWEKVLNIIGEGKKRTAVYPTADVQIVV